MWQHWMGLSQADVPQHILLSWPSCQGAMVGHAPSWSLRSGWLLVGISASQSPVSCPVLIPTHSLEVPGSVLVYLSEV